jgi:hypothetical protein
MHSMNRAVQMSRLPVAFVALTLLFLVCGCGSATGEGFAIYLAAAGAPASQPPALDQVKTESSPLVSPADIVSYSGATHRIRLTPAAFTRIAQLEVPVSGRHFVACVDHRAVYAGAFFVPISSFSFDGVVIMQPLASGSTPPDGSVQLQLGYPSAEFFSGRDPRADPVILESLRKAGKLVD